MKKRIRVYWLLLLVLLYTASAVLSVGEAQARFENTLTGRTVVDSRTTGVISNCLVTREDAPLTVLVGELSLYRPTTVSFWLNSLGEDAVGKLAWAVSDPAQAEYLKLSMRSGYDVVEPYAEIDLMRDVALELSLVMTPTERARTTVHEAMKINVLVTWGEEMWGTFQVILPEVKGETSEEEDSTQEITEEESGEDSELTEEEVTEENPETETGGEDQTVTEEENTDTTTGTEEQPAAEEGKSETAVGGGNQTVTEENPETAAGNQEQPTAEEEKSETTTGADDQTLTGEEKTETATGTDDQTVTEEEKSGTTTDSENQTVTEEEQPETNTDTQAVTEKTEAVTDTENQTVTEKTEASTDTENQTVTEEEKSETTVDAGNQTVTGEEKTETTTDTGNQTVPENENPDTETDTDTEDKTSTEEENTGSSDTPADGEGENPDIEGGNQGATEADGTTQEGVDGAGSEEDLQPEDPEQDPETGDDPEQGENTDGETETAAEPETEPAAIDPAELIRMESLPSFDPAGRLPIKITLTKEVTSIRIGLWTEAEEKTVEGETGETAGSNVAPFQDYMKFSLNQGESYYMMFDGCIAEFALQEMTTLPLLLDYTQTNLNPSKELVLAMEAYAGEELLATCQLSTMPDLSVSELQTSSAARAQANGNADGKILTRGNALEFALPMVWQDAKAEFSLEILTMTEDQKLVYKPVDLEGSAWDVEYKNEENAHSLQLKIGEKLPQAGTYRLIIDWSYEEICYARSQTTFFINYSAQTDYLLGGSEVPEND